MIGIVLFLGMPLFCSADSPRNMAGHPKSVESGTARSSTHSADEKIDKPPSSITAPVPPNARLRPWWLGDLLTVLGILVGVIIVVYQLGRQHKNQLKLQKENQREQFRLQIYLEFSKLLGVAVGKNIDSGQYAFHIPFHVRVYRDQLKKGFSPVPVQDRAMELCKRHNESLGADIEIMFLIERYQIVDPRLDIFRTAISVAHYDLMEAFMPLFSFLLEILPAEIPLPDGSYKTVNIIIPSDDQVHELEKLVNAYNSASDDMGSYLYDLNVEIQNTLLNNLFPNKAPRRKPLDPRFKVISTEAEEIDRLRKYFEEDTNWGKRKKQTEQDVLRNLKRH